MQINFKQPRYIVPLILLPFLCLFFYVWHSGKSKSQDKPKTENGIQDNVGEVSPDVKKKGLNDKLDAFRDTYKQSDGYTAVNSISEEKSSQPGFQDHYSDTEKQKLDSIDQAMKRKFHSDAGPAKTGRSGSGDDKALAAALSNLNARKQSMGNTNNSRAIAKEKDPMDLFKAQMAYMDSVNRANDPAYKAEEQKKQALAKTEEMRRKQPLLEVHKTDRAPADFNTVIPQQAQQFISAIIDEDVTGYAGSRIRLRLLEDIMAGPILVRKGAYLYALINGFNGQRVTLSVQSILQSNQILPVKLDVYDQDGLQGLYVPASAFRDFTKDLSGNTMQGVSIEGSSQSGSQLLMSTMDKVFQSTSSAISSAIRKNKARIKYNSYIYLIDPQALQNAAQNH